MDVMWFLSIALPLLLNPIDVARSQPIDSFDDVIPLSDMVPVIVHEIGHAIGMFHEQSRLDRDGGVEYDYTSVMHYSSMAFTKQLFVKNTIVTKNPHYQRLLGSGRVISFRDAKLANKMYSCSGPPICGGNITEETTIQTPGYPNRESPNDSCSWWIQAPRGKRVMVKFEDFSFYPRLESRTSKYRGRCVTERVEIRTRNMAEGNMFCGEDIKPGTNLASTGQQFIIIITSNGGMRGTRGEVTAVFCLIQLILTQLGRTKTDRGQLLFEGDIIDDSSKKQDSMKALPNKGSLWLDRIIPYEFHSYECPNKGSLLCQNYGYLSPYQGNSEPCTCVCPPNTQGKKCEKITGDYYGSLTCGGDIHREGIIQSPGYPSRKPNDSCTWKIQAPSGKKVRVIFEDFSFRPRMDKPSNRYNGYCVYEHVEIRTSNMDEGDFYCGEDISEGTEMVSSSNTFLILIRADSKGQGRGLKANIKFI
ncbi:Bone morphogenetic protein 1 like protein [Argiope bruennichi]|uniref:Metalloendopeptidase n=1 Tax=Argiope bruennichi TaxID=94029 RepID=A0A8T0ECI1_ARGBR|nr:Bone morphogenetic protein 1 like protein [Argiope bruennichi]